MMLVDISGSKGNAWYLMGLAERIAKERGIHRVRIEAMIADMKSGDYEHLVDVFHDRFGDEYLLVDGEDAIDDDLFGGEFYWV